MKHCVRIKIMMAALISLMLVACQQTQPVRPSGYLVDYSHLKPVDSSAKTLFFEDKKAPWKSYHSIMFSEVIIRVAQGEDKRDIAEKDLKKMRDYFQRTLANSACTRLKFTNKPGEGVILLRSAIVDIKPVNVAVNVVSRVTLTLRITARCTPRSMNCALSIIIS